MPPRIKADKDRDIDPGGTGLPLATLLSQPLVAFTIELDNEVEHNITHWTTSSKPGAGERKGVWLTSLAMYSNLLQYVPEEGITVADLQKQARLKNLVLTKMQSWRYINVGPAPGDDRPKPPERDLLVRATPKGLRAQKVWRVLLSVIEKRWEERFGEAAIELLRDSLRAVVGQLEIDLPDFMPILGFGLTAGLSVERRPAAGVQPELARENLPALLSKVLMAFTLDFEREFTVSLAISANALRVLADADVPVRDLPRLSGVSKEAISMAMGFLQSRRLLALVADPESSRTKVARLTPKGKLAAAEYPRLLGEIEGRWRERFGGDTIDNLRGALEPLVGGATAASSPLFIGLEPYPDGWRAKVKRPQTLPHYPMVLHRGGFPDGS